LATLVPALLQSLGGKSSGGLVLQKLLQFRRASNEDPPLTLPGMLSTTGALRPVERGHKEILTFELQTFPMSTTVLLAFAM
jgi:hypothetical protein